MKKQKGIHLTDDEVEALQKYYKTRNQNQLYKKIFYIIGQVIGLGIIIFIVGLLIKGLNWVF